jgi:hypothetical protein
VSLNKFNIKFHIFQKEYIIYLFLGIIWDIYICKNIHKIYDFQENMISIDLLKDSFCRDIHTLIKNLLKKKNKINYVY